MPNRTESWPETIPDSEYLSIRQLVQVLNYLCHKIYRTRKTPKIFSMCCWALEQKFERIVTFSSFLSPHHPSFNCIFLRMVESSRMEKTTEIHKSNPNQPHHAHPHIPQCYIPTVLEHLHRWWPHHSLGWCSWFMKSQESWISALKPYKAQNLSSWVHSPALTEAKKKLHSYALWIKLYWRLYL